MVEPEPLVGGRYECGPVIGRGAMAEVRAGRDIRLDRPVAIKLLPPEMAHEPAARRRFEAEARMAARLVHPNVVTVFDGGEYRSRPFIVMERLPGWTLRDQLDRGRMPVPAVRALADQVLGALTAAHAAGILHRDIKPGNILMGPDGQWKVADFGIAKTAALPNTADDTTTGLVRGTPAYLAPERFYGAEATVQADLYALGAVLYESLTGRKPFQVSDPAAWATIAATTPLVPVRSLRPEANTGLAGVVERSLSKDPGDRFASAADMTAALAGTEIAPTRADGAARTQDLETTQPLPTREQPRPRPGVRRRTVLGALVALAALSILAAVIGFNSAGNSGAAHRPPVPSTAAAPAPTVSRPPPPTPATAPPATASTASTAPVAPSSAQTQPHSPAQHGGQDQGQDQGNAKGKGKGNGNG